MPQQRRTCLARTPTPPQLPNLRRRTPHLPLPHPPRKAEPLIRQALPILTKAYIGNQRADLSKLTDQELDQLKTALQAVEQATKPNPNKPIS